MPIKKLNVIQQLRGIAALMVVLMHFNIYLEPTLPQLSNWFANGYLGVDIFFIISGVIIYISTERKQTRDAQVFLIRRFCRVVLPAWAAMALALPFSQPYLKELLYGLMFIPLKNSDPPYYGYSFLIVAWTLTYELSFYLIFTATLASRIGQKYRGLVSTAVIIGLVYAIQMQQNCCTLDAQQAPIFSESVLQFPMQLFSLLGNPILLEFSLGMLLAWSYKHRCFERTGMTLVLFLTAPIWFYLTLSLQYTKGHGLTHGGLLAFLIVLYAMCLQGWLDSKPGNDPNVSTRLKQLLPASSMLFLGDISYSLYLTHPIVRTAISKFADKTPIWQSINPIGQFSIAMSCALLLAYVFYKCIELPAQELGRRIANRKSALRTNAVNTAYESS